MDVISRRRTRLRAVKAILLAGIVWSIRTSSALGGTFDGYHLTGSFTLPPGTSTFDVHPDGRIFSLAGATLYAESQAGSRLFNPLGQLPQADISSFGAGFLRFSPDGEAFAVGNGGGSSFTNDQVGVFETATLDGRWLSASHFDAQWSDAKNLALTAGEFGQPAYVSLLDTASADPVHPVNPIVVEAVGGASGGIAFDTAGNLYTSNGFATTGPSGTGEIRYFPFADWQDAVDAGNPLDFENDGATVADTLSAAPMVFDGEGNLLIGGGDYFGTDIDFAALIRGDVVLRAASGGAPADPADAGELRRLDPDDLSDLNVYDVNYNLPRGELLLRDGDTVYVYAVPEPASALLIITGSLALSIRPRARKGR
ncbi:MAG: hypothetical protein J5J06_16890 [Phycisphaerae bacterium]|nr:hypothetical protein [Phycisphaerae bacterium]